MEFDLEHFSLSLIQVQVCGDKNADGLVESAANGQSRSLGAPVEAVHGLLGNCRGRQHLKIAGDAGFGSVGILLDSFVGVFVVPDADAAGSAARDEDVAVLWQMLGGPNCRLRAADDAVRAQRLAGVALRAAAETLRRMLRSHVVHVQSALERRHCQFVHLNVFAVELHGADSVFARRLPPQRHFAEVEKLHVAVVVTGADGAFRAVEAVAESHGPAVADVERTFLGLGGNVRDRIVFLPRIPNLHAAVSAAGDDFFGAAERRVAADGVECVDDVRVCVHFVDRRFGSFDVAKIRKLRKSKV